MDHKIMYKLCLALTTIIALHLQTCLLPTSLPAINIVLHT